MNSRILLIEDEPGLVMTVTDLLTAEGYDVAIGRRRRRRIPSSLAADSTSLCSM